MTADAIAPAPDRRFVVRAEATISHKADIDLVAFLSSLTEAQRRYYWLADLAEFEDDETQRPLAYLWGWLEDSLDSSSGWGGMRDRGFVYTAEDTEYDMPTPKGYDFDALAAQVPWIDRGDVAADPEFLKRIPGPHDVPLFELHQGGSR